MKNPAGAKHTIPAVSRTLDLVQVLSEGEVETTNKALAIKLGLPRTTCYRILQSLIAKNWVLPIAGGRHALSPGLISLCKPLQQIERLSLLLQPILDDLALRTQLTAKVSVCRGDYAITVVQCASPRQTSVAVRIGSSFHLAFGSSGSVLLSGLEIEEISVILERAPKDCWLHQTVDDVKKRVNLVRTKGWCIDNGSFNPSTHTISAPLFNPARELIAAVTLIGFPHELPYNPNGKPMEMLLASAKRAEKVLGNQSR